MKTILTQTALTSYAETNDAEAAFKSLPYKMKNRIEAKLLNGIKSHHENDKVKWEYLFFCVIDNESLFNVVLQLCLIFTT